MWIVFLLKLRWQGNLPFERLSSNRELVKRNRSRNDSKELVVGQSIVEPLSEISIRVLETMEKVSNFSGVSLKGVENQAWELFSSLEKEGSLRGLNRKGHHLHPEVKNLSNGINYEKRRSKVGKEGQHFIREHKVCKSIFYGFLQ